MTQISWQYQVNNRAGGYIVTNTDWNDIAGDLRAFIDQTTSSTTDNTPLPIGIDLANDRVYISDPDSTTPEDGNHADTTLSVVGTTTLAGNTQQTGTFTVGVDDTGHDVKFFGATATNGYMLWDESEDDLVFGSAVKVGIGITAPVTALEVASDNDLTDFTSANRGMFTLSNTDHATDDIVAIDFRYRTTSSEEPNARIGAKMGGSGSSLIFGTSNDYAGITNEALTIDPSGDSTFLGDVTVGVNDTGHDVKLFGATSGVYSLWDQSADEWTFVGADLDMDDNAVIRLGTGDDLLVYASGSNSFIDHSGDGDLWIRTLGSGEDLYLQSADTLALQSGGANTRLYISSAGLVGIMTTSPVLSGLTIGRVPSDANEGGQLNLEGGTSYSNNLSLDRYGNDLRFIYNSAVVGQWGSTGSINIYDAGQLILGTGSDLKVFANGSNSFIDHSGDGDLWVRTLGTGEDLYLNAKDQVNIQTDSTSAINITAGGVVSINPAGSYPVVIGVGNRSSPNGLNLAVGSGALVNVTADYNVAIGYNALNACTTSGWNTAVGHGSMALTTTQSGAPNYAQYNAALGYETLYNMINGSGGNIGIGHKAGRGLTTGMGSVFIGMQSGDGGVATGGNNTAVGYNTSRNLTTGVGNVSLGAYAGIAVTEGLNNHCLGYLAGQSITTGDDNVAIGTQALYTNIAADDNVAIGFQSLFYAVNITNVGVGSYAGHWITEGYSNTMIGYYAGNGWPTTGDNNTCIGYASQPSGADANNEVSLGNTAITALRCQVDITVLSDGRDKDEVEDLNVGLDFIRRLKPRRWSWNMRDGGKVGIEETGFVAQELQQAQADEGAVIPNLVFENNPDRLESSKATLIPVLVKAVQELADKVEALA
jgi:hypothetical protein